MNMDFADFEWPKPIPDDQVKPRNLSDDRTYAQVQAALEVDAAWRKRLSDGTKHLNIVCNNAQHDGEWVIINVINTFEGKISSFQDEEFYLLKDLSPIILDGNQPLNQTREEFVGNSLRKSRRLNRLMDLGRVHQTITFKCKKCSQNLPMRSQKLGDIYEKLIQEKVFHKDQHACLSLKNLRDILGSASFR